MIRTILPISDSTIYEEYPSMNTGIDQILEIGYNSHQNTSSRAMLKFDINELISKIDINYNYDIVLKLFIASEYQLPNMFKLSAYPIAETWTNGLGKFMHTPITDTGVSWNSTGMSNWNIDNFSGSYASEEGGGTWLTNISGSYISNSIVSNDIEINITDIANSWISGSIDNNGIILKLTDEYNKIPESTILKYYSSDTHTIYNPQLQIRYDDSEYNEVLFDNQLISGSLYVEDNPMIVIKNANSNYPHDSINTIFVYGREQYPHLTYSITNEYKVNKSLPITTYYSVIDMVTDEYVIPYSKYTKLSQTNEYGSFFRFDSSMLHIDRYYKFEFKIVWDDYTHRTISSNNTFKIM